MATFKIIPLLNIISKAPLIYLYRIGLRYLYLAYRKLLELLLHLAQKDQTNQKNPKKHPNNPLRCIHYRGGTGGTTVVYSHVRPPDPYPIIAPHNNNKDGRIPHQKAEIP